MAGTTLEQARRRKRFEASIALVAPLLDMILALGERVSRLVGGEDHGHYPVRPPGERFALGPGGAEDAGSPEA